MLSAAGTVQISHALLQFASFAYCGAAEPVYKMASQQEKAFRMPCFEVSRYVIKVQHEFRTGLKKTLFLCGESIFDLEYGGDTFLRNVRTYYRALYPTRRQHS
jgi:hypothetical protein